VVEEMNKFLYQRLAITNIKNNYRTYVPYILTCIGTVMMYFIIHALSIDKGLANMYGGDMTQTLLMLGTWVVAIFAIIFLTYTNSFLMKRRKKEFGLFNILGMEKKHISKIIFYETLFIAFFSLALGILLGILLSKLSLLILIKFMNFNVYFGFSISFKTIIATLSLFGVIFAFILLNNLRQIHLSKPVELLKGGQVGEKEPKTKWLLSIAGFACLGIGYYLAITAKMSNETLIIFFIAVILVIIGTYLVFTTGSIMILKILRRNKNYYYKTKHFISVSGMIYRMKQNAVGLSNICILSTMVLVMLSSTVSLYIGIEDVIKTNFPRNIKINLYEYNSQLNDNVQKLISETLDKHNMKASNKVTYKYINFNINLDKNEFKLSTDNNFGEFKKMIYLIPLEDYNKMSNSKIELKDDEILMYSSGEKFNYDSIIMFKNEYKIKEHLKHFENNDRAGSSVETLCIITNNIDNLNNLLAKEAEQANKTPNRGTEKFTPCYYIAFDLDGSIDEQQVFYDDLSDNFAKKVRLESEKAFSFHIISSADGAKKTYNLFGGLFFLGIFLGLVFIMATVLIMYYKQISEGYDDKERFEIMKKVGMSHSEIRSSIRSQVLIVFFLPIVAAGIHIAFAFPIITKILRMIYLTNTGLFAICTVASILIFTVFYAIVYALTARTYYRLVK
jgi:putative ABC transport system permease protein